MSPSTPKWPACGVRTATGRLSGTVWPRSCAGHRPLSDATTWAPQLRCPGCTWIRRTYGKRTRRLIRITRGDRGTGTAPTCWLSQWKWNRRIRPLAVGRTEVCRRPRNSWTPFPNWTCSMLSVFSAGRTSVRWRRQLCTLKKIHDVSDAFRMRRLGRANERSPMT